MFRTAQSGLSAVHWHSLQCIKVEWRRGKSRENTERIPGFFCADRCEYYERLCTMSTECYDSRQSAGLFSCAVLGNKHKQPIFKWHISPPIVRIILPRTTAFCVQISNTTLGCIHANHSPKKAPLVEPVRWHLIFYKLGKHPESCHVGVSL